MKKFLMLTAMLFSLSSNATVIQIELDQPLYQKADIVTARVFINGFNTGLAGYQIDFSYLQSKLQFIGVVFSPYFSIFDLTSPEFTVSTNSIRLEEMNFFDYAEDLADIQSNSFVIATMQFKALASGNHQLQISQAELTDAFDGSVVNDVSYEHATVKVEGIEVPAPATALLMLPLLALLSRRRAA